MGKNRQKAASVKNDGNVGRPTIRTEENRIAILTLVGEGKSLREISRMEGMPSRASITLWLAEDGAFSAQYARAWQASADIDFEETYEIVDDTENDALPITDESGAVVGYAINKVKPQRDRLRFDQRRWAASKKAPKKYGDKLDLTVGGNGKPIEQINGTMTPEQVAQHYHDSISGD